MRKKEMNCGIEILSPKNSQPNIKYRIGASWTKIPKFVELSNSKTL